MERSKKTNSEYIIDALRSGENLRSPDITERVSQLAGKEMKIQDIASILAKLSNSEKCDLGFFIQKKKTHKGYTYNLVPEAFDLHPEHLYDLTRKTGKNRYTLEQAIEQQPELKKHVKASRLKVQAQKAAASRRGRKPATAAATAKQTRMPRTSATEMSDQAIKSLFARVLEEISEQGGLNLNINLNIRFSGMGE
ncbi:MAG: hypothetical protein ACQERN_09930 [Thermodesulfobacteriota bacterium]